MKTVNTESTIPYWDLCLVDMSVNVRSPKRQKTVATTNADNLPSYQIAESQLPRLLADSVTYFPGEKRLSYYQRTMRMMLSECLFSFNPPSNTDHPFVGPAVTERHVRDIIEKKRAQAPIDHADDRYNLCSIAYCDFILEQLHDYLLQLQHLGYLDVVHAVDSQALLCSAVVGSDASVLVPDLIKVIVENYLGTEPAVSSIDLLIDVARRQDVDANVASRDVAVRHQLHGRERFIRGTPTFHSRRDLAFGRTKEGNAIYSSLQAEMEKLRHQWPAGCVHAVTNKNTVPTTWKSSVEMLSVLRCDMGFNSRDINNVQVLSLEHVPHYWLNGAALPQSEEEDHEVVPDEISEEKDSESCEDKDNESWEKPMPTSLKEDEEHTLAAMLPQWANSFPHLRYLELIMSTDSHTDDYFCRIVYDREVDRVTGHPYLTDQQARRLERKKLKEEAKQKRLESGARSDDDGTSGEEFSYDDEEEDSTLERRRQLHIGVFGKTVNHQNMYVYA